MPAVDVRVLGRVSLLVDGVELAVPGRRERAVLCVLAAQRGQVVSVDRLVDELWGDRPPGSARGSLQVAVSRLRALLEPDRPTGQRWTVLTSSDNGYSLHLDAACVDAARYTELAETAHAALRDGDADAALTACDEAETLWLGAPYADLGSGDLLRADAARLVELRLGLVETRGEALLAAGRPGLAPGLLEGLLAEHPLRERAWQLLALAFYRSGRQGDALAACRRARDVLVEELGVDPSPELQRLEADILAQSASLEQASPVALATPPVGERPPHGLVGRESSLRLLDELAAATVAGRGGTAVVSGEAGIGKTRVVTATAERARDSGAHVLWGRCHEADVSPAFWPWLPVVRELAGADAAPEIAALLSSQAVGPAFHAEAAALRTYDAVGRLLARAARERPLVVVLEDLHWADSASLQLLAYAAEALRGQPVLFVVTVRVPESAPPGLAGCLAALARLSATRVHLDGLDRGSVGELVADQAGRGVDADLADVVAERTDGNPFFVIELVRLLDDVQRLSPEGARDIAVPHGVEDVLRLRLGRLPDDVRRLLGIAAVAGRDFRLDVVARVAGLDDDAALDLLDRAVEAYVVEEFDAPGVYRFTHALVRETLYDGLSGTRRARLHAACGERLEALLESDTDLVAEVAHHLVLGAGLRPELASPASRHAVSAARLAEGRGAHDRARVHWEQALSAEDLARDDQPERRYEVLLGLGRARYRQGDIVGSREALDAAVALAAATDDVDRVAEAATSFRGAGVWHWREFGTSDPQMTEVLRGCLDRLPEGALHARVLASLAMELMYDWRSKEAEPFSRRALDLARRLGDVELFADVAGLHELLLFGRPGSAAERLALVGELLGLGISREQELNARFGAACAHLQAGDSDAAREQMTRCDELARRLRHSGVDVPLAWWRFFRALSADDPGAAELLEAALARHRRSSVVGVEDLALSGRLWLDGSSAVVTPEQVEQARHNANPALRALVARFLAEAGDPATALEVLGDPVPDGAWDYAATYGDCMRVEVLAAAGEPARLPEALSRIEPWQDELAVYGSTHCAGSIAYFVGRGREALGDQEGARAAYAHAVVVNRRSTILPALRLAEARLAALETAQPVAGAQQPD